MQITEGICREVERGGTKRGMGRESVKVKLRVKQCWSVG